MATRSDERARDETRDDSDLSRGFTRRDEGQQAGYTRRYQAGNNGGNVYDEHAGFTKRVGSAGGTRRDNSSSASSSNNHDGYTRRFGKRDLKSAEEGAASSGGLKGLAANGLLGMEKRGNDAASLYTGSGGGGGRFSNAKGFLQKNRTKVIAAGVGGIGIIPLIALLIFMLGALKIPHFVENVAIWRFVSLTDHYRRSAGNVFGTKAALDSLDDAARAQAVQRYGKYKVFDSINRMRPNRVLNSLQTADRIKYEYKTTLTGKQKLVSIVIAQGQDFRNTTTYKVPSGRFDRLVHPLRSLEQYRQISSALDQAIKAHDPKIPTVVRSAATKAVIRKAGGSLKGLVASKYLAKDNTAALEAFTKQMSDAEKKLEEIANRHNEINDRIEQAYKDRADVAAKLAEIRQKESAAFAAMMAIDSNSSFDQILKAENDWTTLLNLEKDLVGQQDALWTEVDNLLQESRTNLNTIKTLSDQYERLKTQVTSNGGVLTDRQAKITLQQEFYERVNNTGGIQGLSSDEAKKLAQDVADKTDEIVKDEVKLGESVDRGTGIPDEVLDVVQKGTDPGRMSQIATKIIGFVNPVYDIAVPVCMMYDGSKITAEDLDARQSAMMRETLMLFSAADQQKAGTDYTTVMAGALNWKAGDIQDSMAMRRVSGKPATTTDTMGGQMTALGTYGQYTVFDALTGGNGGALNGIADSVCPVATNVWFGLSLGVVNIAVVAFSGGSAAAAEAGATAAAKTAITAGIKSMVTKQIRNFTLKKGIKALGSSGRFAKEYAKDVVKWGAITAGATFMARAIVMNSAGTMNSGLETQAAFLDNVDNGANHLANEVGRENYRYRPLNNVEIAQNFKQEEALRAQYNQNKSTFERYLSLENPDSLLTRTAVTTSSLANKSFFASLLNSLATLFNPASLGSRLFASANAQAVYAAEPVNTRDYGNVQWGYSAEEKRLMEQDSYASAPENELRLDQSGKEAEIEATYGKCWSSTSGKLLADGDIARDEQGDVSNEGTCSPQQLGPRNPEYGDLVFRWRLKHDYQNTADLMNGIADPQEFSAGAGTSTISIPIGTAQQLATQILNNPNISFQVEPGQRRAMERIAQTGRGTDCGGPAVDSKLLGVMLAMAQRYKIVVGVVVDDHDCNGGFHPKGQAFDLNGVNKLDGSDGTGNDITFSASELPILREFYDFAGQILNEAGGGGLGQSDCFSGATKHSGVTYFTGDACTHLHVDIGKR